MKHKSVISYCSFAAVLALPTFATAGIRVSNNSARSYAGAYSQVNAMREQEQIATQQYADIETASSDTVTNSAGQTVVLPVRVANAALAAKIANNDPTAAVGLPELEACSRVYPNGEFAWAQPDAGPARGAGATCVSVVEMKSADSTSNDADVVLARAYVAAGTSIKCNISEFPDSGYTAAAGGFIFPADAEPTREDVVNVMNQEQKKSAGLKIAAGALIGGIGGNIAGKNDVGKDGLIGTDKGKMQSALGGALIGAGIGAGNAYAGKLGGDTILSAGVNAAAGGVIGNIAASGDSVLRIEDCELDNGTRKTKCLWGLIRPSEEIVKLQAEGDLQCNSDEGKENVIAYLNVNEGNSEGLLCQCDGTTNLQCQIQSFRDVQVSGYENLNDETREAAKKDKFSKATEQRFYKEGRLTPTESEGADKYVRISYATKVTSGDVLRVMIPDFQDGAFGKQMSDWFKWRRANPNAPIYTRDARGNGEKLVADNASKKYTLNDFDPVSVSAEDGGIVDLSNKARLKSTLTGAGVGGAMGGFVGYQGAQKDIEERWLTAVREYKDSLSRVYCMTGKRFLAQYNDSVDIPEMSE